MKDIFKKKSRLDCLKEKYCQLMRKSFKASLTDQEKSDRVQEQAKKIYEEIQYLNMKLAEN